MNVNKTIFSKTERSTFKYTSPGREGLGDFDRYPVTGDPEWEANLQRHYETKALKEIERLRTTSIKPQEVLDAMEQLKVKPCQSLMTRTDSQGNIKECCALGALRAAGKIEDYVDPYISGVMEGFDGVELALAGAFEFKGEDLEHFKRGHQDGLAILKEVQIKYPYEKLSVDPALDPQYVRALISEDDKVASKKAFEEIDGLLHGKVDDHFRRMVGGPEEKSLTDLIVNFNQMPNRYLEQKLDLAHQLLECLFSMSKDLGWDLDHPKQVLKNAAIQELIANGIFKLS